MGAELIGPGELFVTALLGADNGTRVALGTLYIEPGSPV